MSNKVAKRRDRIRTLLAGKRRATLVWLAAMLRVSSMTVRRDLAVMEADGLILRTPGGCMLRQELVLEASFPEKEGRRRQPKHAIAVAAVKHIRAGMWIYLDTGTTCHHLARALPPHKHLRIFTNNLRIVTELQGRKDLEVFVYGGVLAERNPDLTGDYAIAQMASVRLDLAFTGADALDVETGEFYSADMATALLVATAQRQAKQTIAVIDSSKFGRQSAVTAGRLTTGMTLITDDDVPTRVRGKLRRTGAKTVFARTYARQNRLSRNQMISQKNTPEPGKPRGGVT